MHLFLDSTLLKPLNLLPLLRLGQLRDVPSVVVSEAEEGRLVPILLLAVEVLVVATLEDFVAVRLVVQDEHLLEATRTFLLLVEDLHDLGLVRVDVCEI